MINIFFSCRSNIYSKYISNLEIWRYRHHWLTSSLYSWQSFSKGLKLLLPYRSHIFSTRDINPISNQYISYYLLLSLHLQSWLILPWSHSAPMAPFNNCTRVSHATSFYKHSSLTATKLFHILYFSIYISESIAQVSHFVTHDKDMHIFWCEMTHRCSFTC